MLKEFGQFIMRGNIIDLAVGVIIGMAFNKIIESVVDKLIMPLIGALVGGIDLEKEVIKVGDVEFGWGAVMQNILQFMIVGFVLFIVLKAYNTFTKVKDANYALPLTPTEALLEDLKNLMAKVEENTRK